MFGAPGVLRVVCQVVINDRGTPMELSSICMVFDSTLRCGGQSLMFLMFPLEQNFICTCQVRVSRFYISDWPNPPPPIFPPYFQPSEKIC